jgi:hypothetical protein
MQSILKYQCDIVVTVRLIILGTECSENLFVTSRILRHVVVKALCYKPEGRGFDSRWGEFLNSPNPSGRTRPWGLLSL